MHRTGKHHRFGPVTRIQSQRRENRDSRRLDWARRVSGSSVAVRESIYSAAEYGWPGISLDPNEPPAGAALNIIADVASYVAEIGDGSLDKGIERLRKTLPGRDAFADRVRAWVKLADETCGYWGHRNG